MRSKIIQLLYCAGILLSILLGYFTNSFIAGRKMDQVYQSGYYQGCQDAVDKLVQDIIVDSLWEKYSLPYKTKPINILTDSTSDSTDLKSFFSDSLKSDTGDLK